MSSRTARRRRRTQRGPDPRRVLASTPPTATETAPDAPAERCSITFLVAAAGGTKRLPRYEIQVFATGLGRNYEGDAQWYVPAGDEGVGSAVKTFGGARVHWHATDATTFGHIEKLLAAWMNSDHNIGHLTNVRAADDGLMATLVIDEQNVPVEILDALATKRLGFSVEAFAEKRIAVRGGKKVVELINWHHPDDGPASVAIVSHPALGGAVLSVAASVRAKETPTMDIKDRSHALQVLASADSTPELVAAARQWLRENPETTPAAPPAPAPAKPGVAATPDPATVSASEQVAADVAEIRRMRDTLALDSARHDATKLLEAAKLPGARVTRVLASLDRLMAVDPEMRGVKVAEWVAEEIVAEQKVIDETVRVHGAGFAVGPEPRDKMELRFERLFSENDHAWAKKAVADRFHSGETLVKRYVAAGMSRGAPEYSFRRIMRECLGYDITDLRYSGPEMSRRVQAAFTTSGLTDALENVMHKRFLGHFENPDLPWRSLCRINPLTDFRKVERISRGNYKNLAIVAESGDYTAMTSWGDQGHGYTPAKRGGVDTVTWESMVNDDVGIMRDVAPSMAYAAVRTLFEFVADLYLPTSTAPMDYDSSPLYQATVHGNRATSPLTSTALIAGYKAMYKLADQSSAKRLAGGNAPKLILVPVDLVNTAFDLLKPLGTYPGGSSTDVEWIRRLALEAVTIPHWSDANNWVMATDDACEVGFLQGQEDPEIFLEGGGAQNIGDFLTNDRQKYKVRHVYGGDILRHEKVRGLVVA